MKDKSKTFLIAKEKILKDKEKAFTRYLKEFDMYESFIKYIKDDSYLPINQLIKKYGFECVIEYAFDWDYTDEGFDFWSDADDEWKDIAYDVQCKINKSVIT